MPPDSNEAMLLPDLRTKDNNVTRTVHLSGPLITDEVRCNAGVLLGDIKPANFMLRKFYKNPLGAIEKQQLGPCWLMAIDFGCSQSVGHSRLQRRTGTPVYMSPETFRREYYLEAE